MRKKIIIAGGSGFLGRSIYKRYSDPETEIIILSRSLKPDQGNIRYVAWDGQNLGDWVYELEGAAMIINLTGKSVNCRYTVKNKSEIIDSRVNATRIIGKAINLTKSPPKLWINAGSAAIFGDSGAMVKYEGDQYGQGFSPEVCIQWEAAFNEIKTPHTRKVFLRIGMVLQTDGGVLKPFVNMVRFGLGGKIGSGEQYITWIHETDFLNLIQWVEEGNIAGMIHCSSPHPVKNAEFMQEIRNAVHIPFGLPNPTLLIKLGAAIIGTEAELVLSGRRVCSQVLKDKQFQFKYPLLRDALMNLLN
jgi:uncharacterized protein (TIGR01777 family)